MNLREIVEAWRKILLIARKPSGDEYLTLLKISLLGLTLVGLISFVIRMIFYTLIFQSPG